MSGWSHNLDKLLRAWQRQTRRNESLHRIQANRYSKKFYHLGGVAIVLGSITASGEFATFTECDDESAWCSIKEWVRFSLAILTVGTTALASLQTFLGYEGKSKDHLEAANKYHALNNVIANTLAFSPDDRGDSVEILNSIRNQFEDIVNASPNLPSKEIETELNWVYDHTSTNTQIELTEQNTEDENIIIDIDLDSQGAHHQTQMKMKERMNREMCGIQNNSNTYGVINQLRYQLDRMEQH